MQAWNLPNVFTSKPINFDIFGAKLSNSTLSHLIKKHFFKQAYQIISYHIFQFLWDLISLNTKHANTFLLREVSQVGPRCFLKCLKMAFNGKLAKLIVYLSLEFPLVPEPAVQLMIMLTECNDFLRLYQTSKHAFCTMSFPFIFLAFQTPKQGF